MSRLLQQGRETKLNTKHSKDRWGFIVNKQSERVQFSSVQFSRSVMSDSATPWIAARQASLSITNSWSSLRLTSIESVMLSSHLILCHPLLLLPSIPPSIRVFSNESHLVSGNFQTFLIRCWSKFVKVGIEQRESRWMSERKGSLIKWFTWID